MAMENMAPTVRLARRRIWKHLRGKENSPAVMVVLGEARGRTTTGAQGDDEVVGAGSSSERKKKLGAVRDVHEELLV